MTFKPGDKVRLTENYEPGDLEAGTVLTVREVRHSYNDPDGLLYFEDHGSGIYARRFEKVQPSPKKGDRVRVVVEGAVSETNPRDIVVGSSWDRSAIIPTEPKGVEVTVEVLKPPVEVFQPGDTVRSTSIRSCVFALTNDGGYTDLLNGIHYEHGGNQFTSEHYERVDLG